VLLHRLTHGFQDISVLDNIVEILTAGDNTGSTAIIRPQTIPVRNPRPLIVFLMTGIDLVTTHLRKLLSSFKKFV
jgi:hypothetical protein